MPGRCQDGVRRDLADAVGPPRLLTPLLPVEISQNEGRCIFRKGVGGANLAGQADEAEILGPRGSVVPAAFEAEKQASLGRLSPVDQLPGSDEIEVCRRPPLVVAGERFGDPLEEMIDVQSQLGVGRLVNFLLRPVR